MALPVLLDGGQLEVFDTLDSPTEDVAFITPAWFLGKMIGLQRLPTVILLNRRVTGGRGRKPYAAIYDGLSVTLPFTIVGECDHNGDPFDDPLVGITSNLNYLHTHALLPIKPVRWARHTLPSGDTRIGPVQFTDFPTDAGESDLLETTLSLVFPQGLVPE